MSEQPDDDPVFRRPERPALDAPPDPLPPPRRVEPPFDPDDRPAPVVTESGTFGMLPEDEPLPELEDDSWTRTLAARATAFALFVVASAWLLVLSAHQVTEREVAIPALRRSVAALTELDGLLAVHREAIVAAGESRAAQPGGRVEVPGFPVTNATLSADEARDLPVTEQRDLLLDRSAEEVYANGTDAFRLQDDPGGGAPVFSTEGFARQLLSTLTRDTHERLERWLVVIGLVAVVLTVAVIVLGRGFARFGAVAVALFGAAIVGAGAALVLRLLSALPGGDGAFGSELSAIAEDLAWTPARNALWFAAAAAAIAIPAALGGMLLRRRPDGEHPAHPDEIQLR